MFDELYSPVQHLSHSILTELWVKRDDLIDPYISGNKWRKLKYILQDSISKGKNHLVTFGGAYSNHLVATAAAASKNGLKSTGFVRGEQVENEMLLLCKLYGMKLLFIDRETYKDKQACYNLHFKTNSFSYYIPEGGASSQAVTGCAEIIDELPPDMVHLFCAAGTGTTAAGLLKGLQERGSKAKLHVIPVLKGGAFIKNEIQKYVTISDHLTLHTEYQFGGYAKTKPSLLEFMKSFISMHGMLVDPVYTAKMFFAIDDLAIKGELNARDKIIALHTGGLLGIMGMKNKFYQDV
jgi:1-aminocyclopropane-1-carboxylate deaminase